MRKIKEIQEVFCSLSDTKTVPQILQQIEIFQIEKGWPMPNAYTITGKKKHWADEELDILFSNAPIKRNCIRLARRFGVSYDAVDNIVSWGSLTDEELEQKHGGKRYKRFARNCGWLTVEFISGNLREAIREKMKLRKWTDAEFEDILSDTPTRKNCIKHAKAFGCVSEFIEEVYRLALTNISEIQQQKLNHIPFVAQIIRIAEEVGWYPHTFSDEFCKERLAKAKARMSHLTGTFKPTEIEINVMGH